MRARYVFAMVLVMVLSGHGRGQESGESLPIHAGDLLHVQVFDTPELEQRVRVTDGGEVSLSLIGELKVAGETPAQMAGKVRDALVSGGYMLRPQVSVLVESHAGGGVPVLGQVKSPGTYETLTPRPLVDVIAMAGGLTEAADRNIVIQRAADGKEVEYFLPNRPGVGMAGSPMIYPGDKVTVPKAGLVYVLGDVGRPGAFLMESNTTTITLLQAVALASGTNKTSVPSKARLVRKTATGVEEIPVALAEMQRGKTPDIPLRADDVVFVPFSYLKNAALGAAAILASTSSAAIYSAP